MRKTVKSNSIFQRCILLVVVLLFSCQEGIKRANNLQYVDPQIGGVAPFLQPTRTRMHLPNSMVRMYPDRKDYRDDQIRSFPLTVRSHRSDAIFNFLPVAGNFPEDKVPASVWDQELEIASPYYYSTWLEDFDITVEYSPGEKTGFYRFNYSENSIRRLFLHTLGGSNWSMNEDGTIQGIESFDGMNAFAYGVFDAQGALAQSGNNSWITWPESDQNQIQFKYGISYISLEQARKNLEQEIPGWNFEKVKNTAKEKWSKVMNQIQVEGGTDAYKRTFYTALYRSFERMINITEDGHYFSNYDGQVHADDRNFYVDDWIWDTHLALHPLRFILNAEMESDMISSYIRMYEQSGWLPQFPQLQGDAPAMNGFHSTIMILDAWRKGVRNFDVNMAYEAMKKNALQGTMVPWQMGAACELDTFYYKNGYFPALHPGEKEIVSRVHEFEKRQAVAVTLAASYDDWALAQMAKELGQSDDYNLFSKRSKNFKNLYWKEKGFFMPKDKDGSWIDIDPKFDGGMGGRDYYDENNGWTYLWSVQHDIPGLQTPGDEDGGGMSAFVVFSAMGFYPITPGVPVYTIGSPLFSKITIIMIILVVLLTACSQQTDKFANRQYNTKFVNTFIGTGGHGHTFPGSTSPYGMVQLSPDTRTLGWDGNDGIWAIREND